MKEHHFNIEDAKKYGVEKAVLLYNLRFWLSKEYADAVKGGRKSKIHEHSDGDSYVWTFNSGASFAHLFPYFSERSIRRWMKELEDEGVLLSNNFNRHGYDQTKWYTLPEFVVENNQSIGKNDQPIGQNDRPIPDSNPDTPVIQGEAAASQEKDVEEGGKTTDGEELTSVPYAEDGETLIEKGKSNKPKYPDSKKIFDLWGKSKKGDWLTNTTQRKRAQLLFDERGIDSVRNALSFYNKHKKDQYCPVISSPSDLYTKWDYLLKYKDRVNKEI